MTENETKVAEEAEVDTTSAEVSAETEAAPVTETPDEEPKESVGESSEEVTEEETSATEETPAEDSGETEETVEEKPLADYLDPDLFKDIKTVNAEDVHSGHSSEEVPEEVKNQYLGTFSDISENEVITGRVIGINEKEILVDIGFKSEGIIDRTEFSPEDIPEIGQTLDVYLERLEDHHGNTILSKTKADFMRRWKELREFYENKATFTGKIVRRIKGGMIVDVGVIQAFLPGSQIDVRPVKDFDQYLDQDIDLRIVKFNEARKNIVVSHKAILEDSLKEQREALFEKIKVGEIMEGRVKNITDFGVFIDLGGLDGLLHITDLSWGRINHPSEMVKLDETITVKVIDYDEEKRRVSLGLKQLTPHPWDNIGEKYPVGTVVKGRIVSMTNYGAFIEIEPGVEGLIHVSEMSWTRHVKNPSELHSMGDEVEAEVLSIDEDERKISLGIKQLQPDPWDKIEEKYMVGTVQKGTVSNLTQFGAFVELEEGVDGLIHVSDLSWTKVIRHPKEMLEKGQEVEVRVLEVSRENRRISLGMKQVNDDPWPELIKLFDTGKEVSGDIIRILDKGIIVSLEHDVEGIIPFGKRSKKERKTLVQQYKIGEPISGIVMEVKPDDKKIVLFKEELSSSGKRHTKHDEVQDYLKNQDSPATEKIEIPDALKESGEAEEENPD